MVPTTNMIRNLFYASRSKSVHTVIIDGRIVLDEGRFPELDESGIYAEIRKASAALLKRMGHKLEANAVPRQARK